MLAADRTMGGRQHARERRKTGKREEPTEEIGCLARAVGDRVGLDAANEIERDVLPVHDEGPHALGRDEGDRQVRARPYVKNLEPHHSLYSWGRMQDVWLAK